jgi:apolipoprotein D and lipocalin family protein
MADTRSGLRGTVLRLLTVMAALSGCVGAPEGLTPVSGFEVERYLGRWYEIARLDHSFERGLTDVTAEYARQPDGSISVTNRGFDPAKGRWRESQGVARFTGDASVASLKVSFFRPFWGGYNVLALDRDGYQWAMVAGPSRSYLWILSREPTLDPAVLASLRDQAHRWGFDTEALIVVSHSKSMGAVEKQARHDPPTHVRVEPFLQIRREPCKLT